MTDLLATLQTRLDHTMASEWMTIDQAVIDRFADATLDRQFIHVDPGRAAATPFGGTVAHGFLTLSLLPHLMEAALEMTIPEAGMSINYGFDRLRFVHPVRSGDRIRAVWTVKEVGMAGPDQLQCRYEVTVEIEGQVRPALVGIWITRFIV